MQVINKEEVNDYELIMLYNERDEDAKNILYDKYGYIIKMVITKYQNIYKKFKIDDQELYSEANVGFSDALNNYRDDRATSLQTFITVCVERRLYNLVKKQFTKKHQIDVDSLSLESNFDNSDRNLLDILSDEGKNDPLLNLSDNENYTELQNNIKRKLSKSEYEVYELMLKGYDYKQIANILNINAKQVDNAIQRIRNKIKNIIY